ncbi:MAG TPA: inorganic phosphate transporter [Flavobacterium sp.]|nr:inorganic phosphate transporter [Flavobacterium sp.]
MENLYLVMLIVMAVLAIIDIGVGVSNDAVNFLNSAVGSKAAPFKAVLIVASVGILIGALFSSGMMEIARSGIFVPAMFSFEEVMIIFLTVMVADIILLDIFNYIGFPTSTTVSIVFELLGASFCLALIKILSDNGLSDQIADYINTSKVSEIVISILLSVVLSFAVGALVQYITRIFFTFSADERIKKAGAVFGGIAITAITFFILIKGMKNLSFVPENANIWIKSHQLLIIGISLVVWTLVSQLLISILKVNILKVIILIGTFALAMAFAGNDLVNFIGVPVAAIQSYDLFTASGVTDGSTYMMGELASNEIVAPFYYLLIAGIVMTITLWTSKKAHHVMETELSLSNQNAGAEKFNPNFLSRIIVRGFVYVGKLFNAVLPARLQIRINSRFEKPIVKKSKNKEQEHFDMIRASVNLIVASILISIGTSMKLPLSTTYVTFMVAMGTSLADRAWDRDSAVFRVAGVFNVIGGWFLTGFSAFMLAATVAAIMFFGDQFGIIAMLVLLAFILYRSNKQYKEKAKNKTQTDVPVFDEDDIASIQKINQKNTQQIAKILEKINNKLGNSILGLEQENSKFFIDNKKDIKKLNKSIEGLKSNFYVLMKEMDSNVVDSSKFLIKSYGNLQNVVLSLDFINNAAKAHIANNHKKLKKSQIKDLAKISVSLSELLSAAKEFFLNADTEQTEKVNELCEKSREIIDYSMSREISRVKKDKTSQKANTLFMSILLETNYIVDRVNKLVSSYEYHK